MIRRFLSILAAAGLVIMLAVSTSAAQLGKIEIETKGGTVALYRVGDFEGAQFRLLEIYGGGTVTFDETLTPELAAGLAEKAGSGYLKAADLHGMVSFSNQQAGLYLVVQRAAPEGYVPFSPFLVSLPWDGDQWEVRASPKLEGKQPQTGDRNEPTLWLAAMAFSAAGLGCCIWFGRDIMKGI